MVIDAYFYESISLLIFVNLFTLLLSECFPIFDLMPYLFLYHVIPIMQQEVELHVPMLVAYQVFINHVFFCLIEVDWEI